MLTPNNSGYSEESSLNKCKPIVTDMPNSKFFQNKRLRLEDSSTYSVHFFVESGSEQPIEDKLPLEKFLIKKNQFIPSRYK